MGAQDPEDRRGVAAAVPARASSGDFVPALGQFLGSAKGLSASTITKLTETWKAEQQAFAERDLSGVDFVYLWADGIHVNVRLGEERLCLLVMIGVRADGRKELVALTGGYREAAESWADLLRDCRRRGRRARCWPPGTGRSGSGRAARGVPADPRAALLVPQVIECSCRAAEVGAPGGEEGARRDLERRGQVPRPRRGQTFRVDLWCEVSEGGRQDQRRRRALLAFYDFPAEHWIHLRTTNPIESTFATVRNRSKITKGPGSRAAGLAMAYKLIEAAQSRWRAVNAPHLVALVRAGAKFENGTLVERPDDTTATEEAA